MRLSKYAEWKDRPCGRCRLLVDIGSIVEKDTDPDCYEHQKAGCLVCGELVERATKAHGTLAGDWHTPEFAE